MSVFVIFGAAVNPDGTPSTTLRRRTEAAIDNARDDRTPTFFCSGGVGRYPPAEAELMRQILIKAGIEEDAIVLDLEAADTMDTIRNFMRMINERSATVRDVIVCTSRFHLPRCRLLFRLAGLQTRAAKMPPDYPGLSAQKWLYLSAREVPAIMWDVLVILALRLSGRF